MHYFQQEIEKHIYQFEGSRSLLAKIVEKAENDETYRQLFLNWIIDKSTIQIRELASYFGDYWNDIDYAGAVDGLDSAIVKVPF